MKKQLLSLILTGFAAAALVGCGGGGGGSSQPPVVQPDPPPLVASLDLSASPATVVAGQSATITWAALNTGAANCQASGSWSGQVATSGTQSVPTTASQTAYTASFTLTCGTISKTATVAVTANAPVATNTVPVTVAAGPAGSGRHINVPYVDVTICKPGTNICQTITQVLLDTGSYGLRVFGPLDASLGLAAVKSPNGAEIGQCAQFVSGYTWGSVVQADIKMGGELASSQSIQVVGDAPGGASTAPASCSSTGNNIGSVNSLGARGILGVGLFKEDCGIACASVPISGVYYQCSNGDCSSSTMPLSQQVSNPVASFATNNNGVILDLPSVPVGGAESITGKMIFGIGTSSNNALGNTTKFTASSNGYLSTTYKGVVLNSSFIDSGSNGLFFNDASLAKCTVSTDFYCPPTPVGLSATISSADGTASKPVLFTVEGVDQIGRTISAVSVGAPYGANNTFDWGLPFFYGRKVYVGIEGAVTDPYWAF